MHPKSLNKYLLTLCAVGLLLTGSAYLYLPGKAIQIDITPLLNTRSVTTLTKGVFVRWTNGVDKQNGYLTKSAAELNEDNDKYALPDEPLIAANSHHPAILLHYKNEEGVKNQTRLITDTGEFVIKVPANQYSDLYLGFTSAYGTSSLRFELLYKDVADKKSFIVPDWFTDIPDNDPDFSYIVHNLAKWDNRIKLTEKDHHNIDALNIHPDPKRVLTAIKLKMVRGSYLLLWSATGVKI
jgi:hypothetical protein